MVSKKNYIAKLERYSIFEEQLSHHHPLFILANKIDQSIFEAAFSKPNSDEGRPSKPI